MSILKRAQEKTPTNVSNKLSPDLQLQFLPSEPKNPFKCGARCQAKRASKTLTKQEKKAKAAAAKQKKKDAEAAAKKEAAAAKLTHAKSVVDSYNKNQEKIKKFKNAVKASITEKASESGLNADDKLKYAQEAIKEMKKDHKKKKKEEAAAAKKKKKK